MNVIVCIPKDTIMIKTGSSIISSFESQQWKNICLTTYYTATYHNDDNDNEEEEEEVGIVIYKQNHGGIVQSCVKPSHPGGFLLDGRQDHTIESTCTF